MTSPSQELAEVVRTERRRVLATLVRTLGDLALAEDAVQDAAVAALLTWPRDGVPDDPRAWLTTTARRKALDVVRREARRPDKEAGAVRDLTPPADDLPEPSVVDDDLLRLVFTCCHPALSTEAHVALALRTLCGLDTTQIARLLLVPEPTLAKRLVRARRKIATAGIPYRVPRAAELPERLAGVLAVVYLLYTEGLEQDELRAESLRLARLLHGLMPDEAPVQGLLALLLLTEARAAGRRDGTGALVELPDQDRARWDHALVAEGAALALGALRRSADAPDPYALQAAIAGCHATAATWEATDWPSVVALYDALLARTGSPVVALNRAVAVAERDGAAAGLAAVDAVTGLDGVPVLHAVRGRLLRRLGDEPAARASLERALALQPSDGERRQLERLLAAPVTA